MTQTEHFVDIYDDIYGDPDVIPPSPVLPGRETILFPDIIKIVIDYLNLVISSNLARAHSRIPDDRETLDAFLTVQRTGGPQQTLVTDGAQITIDAWGKKQEDAHALAQLARAYLHSMESTVQEGVTIYGVHEFSGPGFLPDPISEQPRYSFTTQIVYRGYALEL